MGSFLEKLQRRRGAGRSLQAEDIVVRKASATKTATAGRKRAQTSILLTTREPSPEGLLAELTGLRNVAESGDVLRALDPKGAEQRQSPAWLTRGVVTNPQLDILVPAARLVLYELFDERIPIKDISTAVKRAVGIAAHRLSADHRFSSRDTQDAIWELSGLIAGKGPLQTLYEDPFVTDIFIDAYDKIRCRRLGQALETPFTFRTPREYEAFYTSMLQSVERALSVSCPIIDCVLGDEWRSRVNAVHGSLRENGQSSLVIRVPRLRSATLYDLLRSQTMPAQMAAWLSEVVSFGETNILVVGPTGSGKTTLAAGLVSCVGSDERVCTIEDVPEIFASTCVLEKLVTRAPDAKGNGAVTSDMLLKAALHRAPHRLVIGEVRGHEGALFLEALETGHTGSLATMHAENPYEGLWRLLDVVSASEHAPVDVIKRRISRVINLVIVMNLVDGRPCVVDISEVKREPSRDFEVMQLAKYEGEAKGKRFWRKVVDDSPLLRFMSERGVELMTGMTLRPVEAPQECPQGEST
jgi:pilus assembly protein CpaF